MPVDPIAKYLHQHKPAEFEGGPPRLAGGTDGSANSDMDWRASASPPERALARLPALQKVAPSVQHHVPAAPITAPVAAPLAAPVAAPFPDYDADATLLLDDVSSLDASKDKPAEAPSPPVGPDLCKGTIEKIFGTFGFIFGYDGQRYFFHFGTCVTKPELLKPGDEVEFLLGPDRKSGRMHAQKVYRQPNPNCPESYQLRIPNPAAAPVRAPAPTVAAYSAAHPDWRTNQLGLARSASATRLAAGAEPNHLCAQDILSNQLVKTLAQLTAAMAPQQQQSQRCMGLVVAVVPGPGDQSLLLELADHSQIIAANRAALAPETNGEFFAKGDEVNFQLHTGSDGTRVSGLRKLPGGSFTLDHVMGAEKFIGRVVSEMDIGKDGVQRQGALEVIRAPEDSRPTRRYPFSFSGLASPALATVKEGAIVSFYVQAEDAERRAVNVAPFNLVASLGRAASEGSAVRPKMDGGAGAGAKPPGVIRPPRYSPVASFAGSDYRKDDDSSSAGSTPPPSHSDPANFPSVPLPASIIVKDADAAIHSLNASLAL